MDQPKENIIYDESQPDSKNQVTITIIDKNNNERTKVVVERFSEDEMDFLKEMVLRLKENEVNGSYSYSTTVQSE